MNFLRAEKEKKKPNQSYVDKLFVRANYWPSAWCELWWEYYYYYYYYYFMYNQEEKKSNKLIVHNFLDFDKNFNKKNKIIF